MFSGCTPILIDFFVLQILIAGSLKNQVNLENLEIGLFSQNPSITLFILLCMGKLVFQSETKGGGKYTFGNQWVMKSGGMDLGYSLKYEKLNFS